MVQSIFFSFAETSLKSEPKDVKIILNEQDIYTYYDVKNRLKKMTSNTLDGTGVATSAIQYAIKYFIVDAGLDKAQFLRFVLDLIEIGVPKDIGMA